MDLSYSDEQDFLRESVRGTVTREAGFGRVREWCLDRETADHRAPWELAARQGWTGIGVPEELGGQGGGVLELSILAEELGRGAVPADTLYATLLAVQALVRAGADAGTVEPFAAGEAAAALRVGADRPADSPVTDGALVFGAPLADRFLAPGPEGLTQLDASELDVHAHRLVDPTRALATVTGTGTPTPVGELGRSDLTAVAAIGAVLLSADALGACDRMLELTVAYVADRVQFGRPVGSFQAVKHTAAEMLVAIEGTRAALQYAAWALDADEPGAYLDVWVARARAARCAIYVADKALFLHGAVGYTWEHDLQLLFKRAKSDATLFGSAGTYEDRIADGLELVPAPALH